MSDMDDMMREITGEPISSDNKTPPPDIRDNKGRFLHSPGPGRPKGSSSAVAKLKDLIGQAASDTDLVQIASKMVELAKAGDIAAASWVFDRLYGRPRQSIDVQGAMAMVGPDHPSAFVDEMMREILADKGGKS